MTDGGYVVLDTKAFDEFIAQKEDFLTRYDGIKNDFESINKELLSNWKGKGADAFRDDSDKVGRNIGGIYDILKTMCDTLTDCREIFAKCDSSLGEYNLDPAK